MRLLFVLVFAVGLPAAIVLPYLNGQYIIPADRDVLAVYGRTEGTALPGSVNVVVWNVHKGFDQGWEEDLSRLSGAADLVLLQEAFLGGKMRQFFKERSQKNWQYAQSFRYARGGDTTGVALGASVQPREVSFARSPGREPVIHTPKMAVVASYALEGSAEPLLVVNVHGQLLTSYAWYEAQLRNLADIIRKHRGPVIWAGDFNSWTAARLALVQRLAGELGFSPVRFVPDERKKVLGNPIDHVFVRGFTVESSRVYGELRSSDHQALNCVLRLK